MKYLVVAKKWSEKEEKIVTYIAGQFENFVNAEIFRSAYNEHYGTNADIVTLESTMNDYM